MRRPEYVTCVKHDVGEAHACFGKTWCGRPQSGFMFTSIDHAVYNAMGGGRLTTCPECLAAIRKALDDSALDDSELFSATQAMRSIRPGDKVRHVLAPELGIGVVVEPDEEDMDCPSVKDGMPLVKWPTGGSGWYYHSLEVVERRR